ncbi:hypothetical protein AAZX31_18G094600 [Glycine max]|uniref:Uncharacterized protein n=1 Tax=Glycine max TaxID=3847 RepID=K7MQX0_SOYBN|nr:uncharacterized protein LOC100801846 isoform X2 [Glycine max]|eukprot:XP_014626695.1 uncharacterized protein LOC100801846 isoform X2 [Glycine max]
MVLSVSLMQLGCVSLLHNNPSSSPVTLLPKSLFPCGISLKLKGLVFWCKSSSVCGRRRRRRVRVGSISVNASLVEAPVLWAGRLFIFYALLKAGLAGSQANPLVLAKEAANGRKLVSKWHPTTKGTLRRNYRVPSKPEGRRLLKAIASLLSDDDHFVDATSHKGCQIRRESAHGESVCCNNVRALFDELPTPHIIVEITPFPAGPLNDNDYIKAEKLEKVLRSSPSV